MREKANLRAAVAPLLTHRATLEALITTDLPKFTGIKVPLFHLRPEKEEVPPRGQVIKVTPRGLNALAIRNFECFPPEVCRMSGF